MDLETGEGIPDSETGELMFHTDTETGEFKIPETKPLKALPLQKSTFKVPASSLVSPKPYVERKVFPSEISAPTVLFLLPTFFFFHPALAVVIVGLELVIHMWAHKKNKTMKDPQFYYQSPLHVFVSEFCAKCREESSAMRIGRLQDIRNDKFRCDYDYVRRMVT